VQTALPPTRETVEGPVKKSGDDLDAIVEFGQTSLDEVLRRMEDEKGPGQESSPENG
jgi:hypothetical protein